jgi:hypothetical protein
MAHTNGTKEPVDDRFDLRDGVGCESCHGPAEKWLTEHYRDEFKSWSTEKKKNAGMHDTKSLTARVKICAGCHIGSPDRDVDHDLLAAGHPRLSFDFSGYLAMYNKHWPAAEDRARYPDYEARAWLVGQIAGAKASLELLRVRAERAAKGGKIWPEFSEYSCFSCHKILPATEAKRKIGLWKLADPKSKPGELHRNSWYVGVAPMLAKHWPADRKGLDALDSLMRQQRSDAQGVATQAALAVTELDQWLAQLDKGPNKTIPLSKADIQKLAALLTESDDKRLKGADWDEAAQIYIGLSALGRELAADRVNPDPTLTALNASLKETAQRLRRAFPEGVDSPTDYDLDAVEAFQKQMNEIRKLLGH